MTDELVMFPLRNPYDPFLASGIPVLHANCDEYRHLCY